MSFLKVASQFLLIVSLAFVNFYLYSISVRNNLNGVTNVRQLAKKLIINSSSVAETFAGVEEYTRYMTSHFQLKSIDESGASKPEFGPVLNDVHFTYSINPIRDQCRDTNLFIVVVSSPGNVLHRKLIRRTWVNRLDGASKYAFLIGSTNETNVQHHVRNESLIYGDLIQVDMVDIYANLTLKSVALLHWAFNFCPGARFVLKCDDDIYINTRNLAAVIQRLPLNSRKVYGTLVSNLKPMRPKMSSSQEEDDSDKWIVSRQLWPWSTYPSYVSGGCYLIDTSAIAPLLAAAQTTPYFPFEDLYVNGLCARKAQVQVLASDQMLGSIDDVPEDLLDEEFWLVANFVTWLTDSQDEMAASHLATELYFNQNQSWGSNSLFNWTRI